LGSDLRTTERGTRDRAGGTGGGTRLKPGHGAGDTEGDAAATVARLRSLFHARSVALVGATDRSQWSQFTYANLRNYSPGVRVHVVHPLHKVVHGQGAAASLSSIEEPIDLAYVMVPASAALEVVEEAANAGIANIVMLTAGFAETGPAGLELETRLVDLARRRELTILGPNGNGFVNVAGGVTPFGLPIAPPLEPGPVGIVLQSGGLASVVLTGAQATGVGISTLVATGNEAMVSATDVLRYLVADDGTRVVAAFLESLRQPAEFRDVAELALEMGKPVVVLKVGRSEVGARAALAHTGALAGDERVIDGVFRQLGVVRVDSLEELLVTAGYFAHYPHVRGRRIAAVLASGGACDLLADRASADGLELPAFDHSIRAELADVLPTFSNLRNPLDVTGYVVVDPSIHIRSLEIVVRHAAGTYDMALYSINTLWRVDPADPGPYERRMDDLAGVIGASTVPVVLQTALHSELTPFAQQLLSDRNLWFLPGIELGTRAIGHGAGYHERRIRRLSFGRPQRTPHLGRPEGARGVWPEHRVRRLLADHGIPVAPARLATSPGEAAAIAAHYGEPVAMKIASPDVAHKSDMSGVHLDVSPADAAGTYKELAATLATQHPDAILDGVLVGPMRRGGVELLVGVVSERDWGKVLSVGMGGVWVEVLGDVALRALPVDEGDVAAMVDELRAHALLLGGRGRPPADMEQVVATVLAIARLAEGLGDAVDVLEVNPLRVDGEVVEVLDALAVWRDPPDGECEDEEPNG
jgi:acetate---CoA ligase (ADP-forming)